MRLRRVLGIALLLAACVIGLGGYALLTLEPLDPDLDPRFKPSLTERLAYWRYQRGAGEPRLAHKVQMHWTTGAGLAGRDLVFLRDGGYWIRPWCDICPRELRVGTWRWADRTPDRVDVEEGGQRWSYALHRRHGCDYLVNLRYPRGEDGDITSRSAYQRPGELGDGCRWRLHACPRGEIAPEACEPPPHAPIATPEDP